MEELIDDILKPYKDGFDLRDIWDTVSTLMAHAEVLTDLDTGPKKKQFVLDILDTLLDRVDLPGPDWIAKRVIMWLAPTLIDKFVAIANG